MSLKIFDCEQGTKEWLQHRNGIITMSRAQCLMVNGKSESGLGAEALSYADEIVGEQLTGKPVSGFFGNEHTERGHEMEPHALAEYSSVTQQRVEKCGIMINHGVGYSPDGVVGEDGLVEVKSKLPKLMVKILCDGGLPKEHVAQCQGGLWVSGREWIDFVAYWPGMPLFVKRVHRDEEFIKKLASRCDLLYSVVEDRKEKSISNGYEISCPW